MFLLLKMEYNVDSCYHPIFALMHFREDQITFIRVTVTTTLEQYLYIPQPV